MAISMRSGPGRPALFRTYDEAIEALR
jgi:hypothetical protein